MTMLGLLLACADTRLLLVLRYGWMLEQDPEQLASRLLFILTFSAAIPVTTNLFKELNKGKTLGIF